MAGSQILNLVHVTLSTPNLGGNLSSDGKYYIIMRPSSLGGGRILRRTLLTICIAHARYHVIHK